MSDLTRSALSAYPGVFSNYSKAFQDAQGAAFEVKLSDSGPNATPAAVEALHEVTVQFLAVEVLGQLARGQTTGTISATQLGGLLVQLTGTQSRRPGGGMVDNHPAMDVFVAELNDRTDDRLNRATDTVNRALGDAGSVDISLRDGEATFRLRK